MSSGHAHALIDGRIHGDLGALETVHEATGGCSGVAVAASRDLLEDAGAIGADAGGRRDRARVVRRASARDLA